MNTIKKMGAGITVAAVAVAAMTFGSVASFAWEPNKPIEFVIMAARAAAPTRWRVFCSPSLKNTKCHRCRYCLSTSRAVPAPRHWSI